MSVLRTVHTPSSVRRPREHAYSILRRTPFVWENDEIMCQVLVLRPLDFLRDGIM